MLKKLTAFLFGFVIASNAQATDTITADNLGDVLSGLNQKEVYVEGELSKNPYDDDWIYTEAKTGVYFRPIMLVRPANLRRLKEGCTRHSWGDNEKCKIKALAELDTTEGRVNLIIFQILEATIPQR